MQLARGREPVSGSATLGVRGDYAISSGGGAPLKTTPTGHISSLQLMLQVQVRVRLGGSSPDLDSPKGQRGEGRQAGRQAAMDKWRWHWRPGGWSTELSGGASVLGSRGSQFTSAAVSVGTKQWRQLSVRTASGISGP